jgi:hypothetical protein
MINFYFQIDFGILFYDLVRKQSNKDESIKLLLKLFFPL